MNCKQGDLAIVLRSKNPGIAGRIVEVIDIAPRQTFVLPNGVLNVGCPPEFWIVKSSGSPFLGALGNGMFCTGPDSCLRPIRGDLLNDETTTSKELEAV